jgi:hypothetical protein
MTTILPIRNYASVGDQETGNPLDSLIGGAAGPLSRFL